MKRWFLVLAAVLALAGCIPDQDPELRPAPEIDVVQQDWTGWQREQPEPEEHTLTGAKGERLTVRGMGGELTVEVTGVGDETVEIETSQSMSQRVPGRSGIDLTSDQRDFTVRRGEPLEITTTTTDQGTTLTLTW